MDIKKSLPTLALVVTVASPVWYMAVTSGAESKTLEQLVEKTDELSDEIKEVKNLITDIRVKESNLTTRVDSLEREVY